MTNVFIAESCCVHLPERGSRTRRRMACLGSAHHCEVAPGETRRWEPRLDRDGQRTVPRRAAWCNRRPVDIEEVSAYETSAHGVGDSPIAQPAIQRPPARCRSVTLIGTL